MFWSQHLTGVSFSELIIVAVPSTDPFLNSGENKGSSLGVSKTII